MLLLDVPGRRLRSIHWEGTPMRNRTRSTVAVAAVTIAAGAGLAGLAGPAHAAQSTMSLTCAGQQLTVRVNTNHSSEHGGWGVGQIVADGTGHLVPTAFSGSLVDTAHGMNQTLFTFAQAKGGGNANHNQQTVTCTGLETGVLGDFLNPGDTPPPGTSVTDPVTFTLTVIAVQHS